jgi:hypothetical protein
MTIKTLASPELKLLRRIFSIMRFYSPLLLAYFSVVQVFDVEVDQPVAGEVAK